MWNSRYRYTDECFKKPLENYKVGDWLKKTHEKVDREKEKIQKEKKRADRLREEKKLREEKLERLIAATTELILMDLHKAYKEKNAEKKEKLREREKREEKEKESKKKEELKEKEKESENKEELIEKEIDNKDAVLDSCYIPNIFPSCDDLIFKKVVDDIPNEACKKEDDIVLPKEQSIVSTELQVKNIGKSWHTTTLVPTSKLVCAVKCWNSSSVIHLPKISSSHEGNQVNDEEYSLVVTSLCELEKYGYVSESKGETGQANQSHELAIFSIGTVPFGEFFRLVFDPGGIRAMNSRSNSLEEGGNDGNLGWMPLK